MTIILMCLCDGSARVHSAHGSYSSTVRLAKRWLASQMMLSDYVAEESVELIVASLYLSPAPFTPPQYEF